jgi:hypothetical protein
VVRLDYLGGIVLAHAALAACHPPRGPAVDRPPLWEDPDRRPFVGMPSGGPTRLWDGLDHTVFRPTSQLFAVDPGGEATNVNAMDEVPSSSWFTNRIGLLPMSPEEVAVGPCTDAPLDTDAPMTVESSKLDGQTPGVVVRSAGGLRYVLKLDDVDQSPRPTAADAIASRLYYAAGFTTPCNRVVFFDASRLTIAPGAKLKTWTGKTVPFTRGELDLLLTHASRLQDGRYRALASQWLQGKPIGPWRYEDVRSDDPNDVVPHEDRREIRGTRLLAAWLDNTDASSHNTLDVWIAAGHGSGWVRHAVLDFSDSLGAIWWPDDRWRRMGHAYWFDLGLVAEDFVTLGVRTHSWDRARLGASGKVFGYYDVDAFDPEAWKPAMPNTAFARMTERDGAWMARIIARFTDAHLERIVRTGRIGSATLEQELLRILRGRRDLILRRYLARVSPLARPSVRRGAHGAELCTEDLAVGAGLLAPRTYAGTLRAGDTSRGLRVNASGASVCIDVPAGADEDRFAVVDVAVLHPTPAPASLHVHVRLTRGSVSVVGVTRPEPGE